MEIASVLIGLFIICFGVRCKRKDFLIEVEAWGFELQLGALGRYQFKTM